MRILASSIVVAASMAWTAAPVSAAMPQGSPPAYARVEPGDCGALVAKYGRSKVWQASFRGHRGGDGFYPLEWTFVQPCFATQRTCVAWLYWEQSDWPEHDAPGRCRQGAPYSGF